MVLGTGVTTVAVDVFTRDWLRLPDFEPCCAVVSGWFLLVLNGRYNDIVLDSL